jgi:hypothetical protein
MKARLALIALLLLTYPIVSGWTEAPEKEMKSSDFYSFGIVPSPGHYRLFGQVRLRVEPEDFQNGKTFTCNALLDGRVTAPLGEAVLAEDPYDLTLPPPVRGTVEFNKILPIEAYWILECATTAEGTIIHEYTETFLGRPSDGTP